MIPATDSDKPGKPKILFIGDYCRTDYLRLLAKARDACHFWFLFYTSPDEEQNKNYLEYGKSVYWSDFRSAQALLKNLAPDKVLFLYIDTYHALVLKLACTYENIPTYHLEHGMRADYAIGYDLNVSPELHQKPFRRLRYLASLLQHPVTRIKARLFLKNSIRQFSAEDAAYAKAFIAIRSKHNYLETFKRLPSGKRNADYYISFSPKIYQVHAQHDKLPPDQKVYFTGVPYFDDLANITPQNPRKAILFIDQPLAEHRLLQWTAEYKKNFIQELTAIVTAQNYELFVKPHPRQDISLWQNTGIAVLIDDKQLREICSSIPIVMGFYSTYLMPFAAMPHTTLITFENHPAGKLEVSKPFTAAKVARAVYAVQELKEILPAVEQLHQQQLLYKKKFTAEWLYKFDGKSEERLCNILLKKGL